MKDGDLHSICVVFEYSDPVCFCVVFRTERLCGSGREGEMSRSGFLFVLNCFWWFFVFVLFYVLFLEGGDVVRTKIET